MSKTLKKTLSIIIAILMIATTMPIAFAAGSGTCGASTNDGGAESVKWTLDSTGKLTISGTGDMEDYAAYNKSPFNNNSDITTVVIENGVTSIGGYAFYGCTNLESITIGNSVTSIGRQVFYNCKSLASIEIPNSVISIGYGAFWSCEKLASIKIGNSLTSIDVYAFYNCISLESIEIPASVTNISQNAFMFCTGLKSIEIPGNVTSINNYTFSRCNKLESITIPASVTTIGNWAFYDCTSLTLVHYLGTSDQWNKIEIGSTNNNKLTGATRHYCTEKEAIDATCTEAGYTAGWYCADCEEYVVGGEETAALGHVDADGDYVCDNGCGHEFEKPVAPTPDTPDEPTANCKHLCHCVDAFIQFFWKIVNFIQKLFGMALNCICGATH